MCLTVLQNIFEKIRVKTYVRAFNQFLCVDMQLIVRVKQYNFSHKEIVTCQQNTYRILFKCRKLQKKKKLQR
jgi:hypothetical protein